MTPVEKWNNFSEIADPIAAFGILIAGIGFLAAQKKMAALREVRILSGELSREEAAKNARLVKVCAYVMSGCGFLLVVMWLMGA